MKTKKNLKNFAIIFGCIVLFAACNGNNNNNNIVPEPDENIYIPPANLTSAEILALVVQANEQLLNENEMAIDITGYSSKPPVNFERRYEVNFAEKKMMIYSNSNTSNGSTTYLDYYEGQTYYTYYDRSDTHWADSYNLSTAFWKYYSFSNTNMYSISNDFLDKEWRVEDEKLVAEDIGDNYKSKLLITLNKDKKYLKVSIYYSDDRYSSSSFQKYSYSVDPQLPFGYQKNQFTVREQCSMQVYWGEEFGTDTYYSNQMLPDEAKLYALSIQEAPHVAGKMPVFYFDAEYTQLVDFMCWYYSDYVWTLQVIFVGIYSEPYTLYAKWEDLATIHDLYKDSSNAHFLSPAKMPKKNYLNFLLEQEYYFIKKL